MSTFLFVLSVILRVLLVILIVVVALVLLILLCPIRYEAKGSVKDPQAHEKPDFERLKDSISGHFEFSYLFSLIGGSIGYPDETTFRFRIAWKKFTLDDLEKRREAKRKKEQKPDNEAQRELDTDRKSGEQETEEEPPAKEEQTETIKEEAPQENPEQKTKRAKKKRERKIPDLFSILDKIGEKIEHLSEQFSEKKKKIRRWIRLLEQESTKRAVQTTMKALGKVLKAVLPRRWSLSGEAGLGDPDLTGTMLDVIALTWPWSAGHVSVQPEFMAYQADLQFEAKGRIILLPVLVTALRFWFNKDVKLLRQRIRKLKESA